MEWTATNSHHTKHHITVLEDPETFKLAVTIIRLRVCGGIPKKITRQYNSDIGFNDCMTKINTIVELDEELYSMVVESQI